MKSRGVGLLFESVGRDAKTPVRSGARFKPWDQIPPVEPRETMSNSGIQTSLLGCNGSAYSQASPLRQPRRQKTD
jgi:hypothetical protein